MSYNPVLSSLFRKFFKSAGKITHIYYWIQQQAHGLYTYFVTNNGFSADTLYATALSTNSSVKYVKFSYKSWVEGSLFTTVYWKWTVTFYDNTMVNVVANIYTLYVEASLSSSGSKKIDSQITVTAYTGGDKLILSSDVPISSSGLDDYQIYLDNGTLKAKLPS